MGVRSVLIAVPWLWMLLLLLTKDMWISLQYCTQ
jgi:hypothetical protein